MFNNTLCYIQAVKKSLKISVAIIRNTANLRKTLHVDNAKIYLITMSHTRKSVNTAVLSLTFGI